MRTCSRLAAGVVLLAAMVLAGDAFGQPEVAPAPRPKPEGGPPLPPGTVARIGRPRLTFPGPVIHVAFAPTGTTFVSAGNPGGGGAGADRTLVLWEVPSAKPEGFAATVREVRRFAGHPGGVEALAYSSDGKRIVTGGRDKLVRLWDVTRGDEVRQFAGHTAQVLAVAYSPDRKLIASAGHDLAARVWDAETAKELRRFPAHKSQGTSNLQFSPDGSLLALVSPDFSIRLWNPDTGDFVARLTGPTRDTLSLNFSRDGKRLAGTGEGGTLWVWEVANGKELAKVQAHTGTGACVRFSPNGEFLATGGSDGAIHFWDADGKRLRSATGHPRSNVSEISFSADGSMLASAGHDGTVRLWDVATGAELPQSGGTVSRVALSPDGKWLATSTGDRLVRFWEPTTGKEILPALRADRSVAALAFAPDGSLVTSDSVEGVWVWDIETGRGRQIGAHGSTPVARLAVGPGGRYLATAGSGATFRLWEAATGKQAGATAALIGVIGSAPPVQSMAWSRTDARLALGCGDGRIHLWDPDAGRELYAAPADGRALGTTALAWSPDGRSFASVGGVDRVLRVWEAVSGRERFARVLPTVAFSVAFSPDRRLLAAGGSGFVYLCDARTGTELASRPTDRGLNGFVAFTADGRFLVTASPDLRLMPQKGTEQFVPGEGTALVWDVAARVKERPTVTKPAAGEVDGLWRALSGADAAAAGDAVWRLTAAPELSFPLLKERLPKVAPGDADKRVEKLLTELDADDFEVREKATQELIRLGPLAIQAVRDTLATTKSREVRRRAEEIVAKSTATSAASTDELLLSRGVEVLQRMDTDESRRLLEVWAAGPAGAILTREAKAALGGKGKSP